LVVARHELCITPTPCDGSAAVSHTPAERGPICAALVQVLAEAYWAGTPMSYIRATSTQDAPAKTYGYSQCGRRALNRFVNISAQSCVVRFSGLSG